MMFIFFIICSLLGAAIGAAVGNHYDHSITPDCWIGLGVGVLIGIAPLTNGDSIDCLSDLF